MKDIWKDIEGFEGLYQISNIGQAKSLKDRCGRYREKILKPRKNRDGYLQVCLYKNKKCYTKTLHRLVAITFIPNPNNYPQVNHKKEFEKDNNGTDNLEWISRKENMNYGTRTKRSAEKRSKKVYQYTLEGKFIKDWNSLSECGRNGFNFKNISSCCNGKRKTHKKFRWSFSKSVI